MRRFYELGRSEDSERRSGFPARHTSEGSGLNGLLPEPLFSLNLRSQFDLRVFEGKSSLLQLQVHSMLFSVLIKAVSEHEEIKVSRNTPFSPLTNAATPFFG